MQDVNAKRSINAAKRSLAFERQQDLYDNCPFTQVNFGEVTEYYMEAQGNCREIVLPGFWIQVSSLPQAHRLCLHSDKRHDVFQIHFSLLAQASAQGTHIDIAAGTGNFLFLPKHLPDYCQYGETSDYINFEINFLPEYFYKQFAGFLTPYTDFYNRVQKAETALLSLNGLSIQPKMKQIIADILECRLQAPFNKVYLSAKVHELLIIQLEQFSQQKQQTYKLNPTDKVKLALVKDMLLSRPEALSLHELSLESGLNLDKLKKGFKALYGTTIFGYLSDIKMEEARHRLLSMDTTVTEVSEKAGYKNPQHFTAAFKRKYGILPRDMRC